jgi:hypothetical protein
MALRPVVAMMVILLHAVTLHAGPILSPDEEVARREFAEGVRAYTEGEYDEALRRFSTAQIAHPAPEFDYNIGRCQDRLGHWQQALDAYERYVDARPNGEQAQEVRERIAVLRARIAPAPTATVEVTDRPLVTPVRASRRRVAPGLVLGGALALGGAGGAVYGAAYAQFAARRDQCMGACAPGSHPGLTSYVRTSEITSGLLFALAGGALVGDVVLWVLDARARRRMAPVAAASFR